jgi:hypothetical protein
MNGEHLSPKTRELLDKPIEERIAHIQKDSWIPYSQANKILQQLEDLLQHPKCDRMPNLAISAQTNNGKTRLMKHFLSLHQATETSSGTIAAPVFYVQSPSIPEESRLYSAILLKLCKKFRPSAPPQEKLVLVLDALSKIEIRILALDEVNFTEVGTAAKQKRFLNALRYLANELRISIVCLGTEEMMRVIRSVSSVENRFPPTILPRWRTDDEFRQLLASLIRENHPAEISIGSARQYHPDREASDPLGGYDWRTQDAPRRGGNGRDAQRNGAHHRRDHCHMQLCASVRTKAAISFRLTRSAIEHLHDLPPDS